MRWFAVYTLGGYNKYMSKKNIENRLHRIEGQLASVCKQLDTDAPCEAVIPQFLAVKAAFSAAFTLYVKEALAECSGKDTHKRDALVALLLKS